MAKGDVLINLVLDQSGSMGVVREATINGVNAFLEEQVRVEGNAYLTLTLFDDDPIVRFTAGDLAVIPPLAPVGKNPYVPSGSTALYDAVMTTIDAAEKWVGDNHFKDQVVVAIMTDGQENASQNCTLKELNTKIREKKEQGWEFVFMGSGQAAWTEGENLLMDAATSINFAGDAQSMAHTYSTFSASLAQSRTTGQNLNTTMPMNTQQNVSWQPENDATNE